jgi:serine/threonine-protein kinase
VFEHAARGPSILSLRRGLGLLLKGSLLALGLLGAAGLSAIATMRVVLSSQEVSVPSVIEKRLPEAGAIAAGQGLLLRVEGKRHDIKVPADRVVAQEPAAGSGLKTGRSIRVWLSLGPQRLSVPAVEGGSLRTGRLALEQSGLQVVRVVEVDAGQDEGTILVQRPPAGEADDAGQGVSLLASRGRARDYVMPDLIGRRAEDVLPVLHSAGLKVADVRYRSYPGVAAGIVLRQAPPAGHRVSPRGVVSLDVSKDAS